MNNNKSIKYLLLALILLCCCGCGNKYKDEIDNVFSFTYETCEITQVEDFGCVTKGLIKNNLKYKIKNQNNNEATIEIETVDFDALLMDALGNAEYSDDYYEYLNNIQKFIIDSLNNGHFEIKCDDIVVYFEETNGEVSIVNKKDIANFIFGGIDDEN